MAEDAARELATTRHGHAATIGAEPHGKISIFRKARYSASAHVKNKPIYGLCARRTARILSVYTPHGASNIILV
jgi:hypothetical protein